MNISALKQALSHRLPASEKMALATVASMCDDSLRCDVPQSILAQQAGMSVRTLQLLLQKLAARGLVEIRHRGIHTNEYRLNISEVVHE